MWVRVWQQPNSNSDGWLTYAKIIFRWKISTGVAGLALIAELAHVLLSFDFHRALQSTFNQGHSSPHWPVAVPYPEQLGPLFLFSVFTDSKLIGSWFGPCVPWVFYQKMIAMNFLGQREVVLCLVGIFFPVLSKGFAVTLELKCPFFKRQSSWAGKKWIPL